MTINRRTLLSALTAAPAAALISGRALAQDTDETAAPTTGLPPVLHQFSIGDARVTVLLDGHLPLGTQLFANFDADKANAVLAKGLHQMTPAGLQIPVQGYLVERGSEKILIDAGTADLMGPNLGAMRAGLAAMIGRRFKMACRRLGLAERQPDLRADLFERPPQPGDQLGLF